MADTTRLEPTRFLASQPGGTTAVTYSYTDMPWRLILSDAYYFFRYLWSLPYVLWPLVPADSEELSELSPTKENLWCVGIHAVLIVLQSAFLLGLPFLVAVPVWVAGLVITGVLLVNKGVASLLNGEGVEYRSEEKYAPERPEHAGERWIYINGVSVGSHWMQMNLNRLAVTFKRPVIGIHNKTSGMIFDILECLVQRNWGYATRDVRVGYRIIKQTLYDQRYHKIIFILHSQGAIEGSLILDWLLQELPQDLLAKLEVYSFGNAANHFNNPHRCLAAQDQTFGHPHSPSHSPSSPIRNHMPCQMHPSGRAISHIEHYAHTLDFVALWGILRFVMPTPITSPTESTPLNAQKADLVTRPRFLGRVFIHPRPGHLLVQHYLDGMFPLQKDPVTGKLLRDENGVPVGLDESEGNKFMEGEVIVYDDDDELGGADRRLKVKQLSRLWEYRNGRSPRDESS